MINVQVSGMAPLFKTDFTDAMEKAADIMFRSVQQNFIDGGRPNQWEPLQPFGEQSHLYKTGNMFESIQIEWGEKSASVFIDTERVPYARIHNEGGTIKHPGSNKFQAFGFGDGMVFTHYTKPHDIQIPRRQFMLFQDEDKTAILELLSNAIFSESGTVT